MKGDAFSLLTDECILKSLLPGRCPEILIEREEHLKEVLPEFRKIQMLVNPAKCALHQERELLRHVISFVGVGIFTEGGYQVLGPTRGPHRALRNPESGFNEKCRQTFVKIAVLFTDMHAQKGHDLLGLKRARKLVSHHRKHRLCSASLLLSRIPTWTMGYLLCYGTVPKLGNCMRCVSDNDSCVPRRRPALL